MVRLRSAHLAFAHRLRTRTLLSGPPMVASGALGRTADPDMWVNPLAPPYPGCCWLASPCNAVSLHRCTASGSHRCRCDGGLTDPGRPLPVRLQGHLLSFAGRGLSADSSADFGADSRWMISWVSPSASPRWQLPHCHLEGHAPLCQPRFFYEVPGLTFLVHFLATKVTEGNKASPPPGSGGSTSPPVSSGRKPPSAVAYPPPDSAPPL